MRMKFAQEYQMMSGCFVEYSMLCVRVLRRKGLFLVASREQSFIILEALGEVTG
jgi:hypothetical protein